MQQIDVEPAGKVRLAAGLPSSPWGDLETPDIAQIAALRWRRDAAGDLQMITNRGVKVWPNGIPETSCTDHWRCRYIASPGKQFNRTMVIDLLRRFAALGVDFIKTEHLYLFDGEAGFSLGQGQ